jgi:hypothetical protein
MRELTEASSSSSSGGGEKGGEESGSEEGRQEQKRNLLQRIAFSLAGWLGGKVHSLSGARHGGQAMHAMQHMQVPTLSVLPSTAPNGTCLTSAVMQAHAHAPLPMSHMHV